jgi:magnesium transporter
VIPRNTRPRVDRGYGRGRSPRRRLPMSRLRGILSRKAGLPPGTLVYVGEKKAEKVKITVIDYSEDRCEKKVFRKIEDVFPYRGSPSVTWINIDGLHVVDIIEKTGAHFDIHPLVMEDILNTNQRPKVEDHEDYIFLSFRMTIYDEGSGEVKQEQVSLVLGPDYVISFQEKEGDVFDAIRGRIMTGKGRIRRMGADYLAYSLLDAVVDGYFGVIEKLGDRIETLEEELIEDPGPGTLQTIHDLKREVLYLRKSIWPLREVVSHLEKSESTLIADSTDPYLRDVYDHTIQVIDALETYRDLLSGMVDLYLSSVSNRMNEVMKVLTIIATIFIPLTFIAGIYGMNFDPDSSPYNMPELAWYWGYPLTMFAMLVVALLMVLYFRRKNWF